MQAKRIPGGRGQHVVIAITRYQAHEIGYVGLRRCKDSFFARIHG